jgi:hypothetical protein
MHEYEVAYVYTNVHEQESAEWGLVRGYKQTHRFSAKYLVNPKTKTIMKVTLIFLCLSGESLVEDAIMKVPYILNLENVLI